MGISLLRTLPLAALTLIGSLSPGEMRAQPDSRKIEYPEAEAARVYRAVLDELYRMKGARPAMIVMVDSTSQRLSTCIARPCPKLAPHKSAISDEVLNAFYDNARDTRRIPTLRFRIPVQMISLRSRDAIAARGKQRAAALRRENPHTNVDDFWAGFSTQYPGAWGITQFSNVAFDRARTEALVQLYHACSSSCSSIDDIYLTKSSASKWRVIERLFFREGSGEGMGIDSLRWIGPNATMRETRMRMLDSTRKALADSIALERAPRRVTAKIVNRATGKPFKGITVIATPMRRKHRLLGPTDSRGLVHYKNPPVGWLHLVPVCPPNGPRPKGLMYVGGVYVRAGTDTTVRIEIPTLAPCWKPAPTRRLHSGWFEYDSVRSSPIPSAEAAAVYATILEVLAREHKLVDTATRIMARTRSRCVMRVECGSTQLYRLRQDGLIDQSTIDDFIRQTLDSAPLRPGPWAERNVDLLSPPEIAYHHEESARTYIEWPPTDDPANMISQRPPVTDLDSAGVISLSAVGFNPTHDQALLEVSVDVGVKTKDQFDRYRVPELMLLHKRNGRWEMTRRSIQLERTSGTYARGQCIAVPAASAEPSPTHLRPTAGTYEFTKITTSRAVPPVVFTRRIKPADDAPWRSNKLWKTLGDGSMEMLTIRTLSGDSFFGSWHSGRGNAMQILNGRIVPDPAGFFCARKISS